MTASLTTPPLGRDVRGRSAWPRRLVLLALLGLVTLAVARRPTDPLAARLAGTWQLKSTPSASSEPRTIEFHADGRFWIYPAARRSVNEQDAYRWHVSHGELVVVFDDPLRQSTTAGQKVKELGRRLFDLRNVRRSCRYAVSEDARGVITIGLLQEWGNPPVRAQSARLTRNPDQRHGQLQQEPYAANPP